MKQAYKCIECDDTFSTKGERDSHLRGECRQVTSLTGLDGSIKRIERVDGKFICPSCYMKYARLDNLTKHWKTCRTRDDRNNEEDILVKYLLFDGDHNVAVCTCCKYALPLEWIQKHFKDSHKVKCSENQLEWLEEWFEENEVKILDHCKLWKDSMPILRSPIMGIPSLLGSGCPICNFSHQRQREVITHIKSIHGIEDNMAPIACSVQQLFSSHLRGFWRIQTPVENIRTDDSLFALNQFSAEFQRLIEQDNRSTVVVVPSDERLRSAWMTKCDWDILLEGMSWQVVKDMTKKPNHRDPEYKVLTAVKLYLSGVCAQLRKTGLSLRHQMLEGVKYIPLTIEADISDHEMGKTFHALQEKSTIDSYAEMMGVFLVFCLRTMDDTELQWNDEHPLTEEQERNLIDLQRLVGEDDGPVSEDRWSPVIHTTLKAFVNCDEVKRMVAEVEWPLYRFLISISVNVTADGFSDPDTVPHVVKKLVYCIRANVFEQARQISELDNFSNDHEDLNERPTLDSDGGMFGLKKYVVDKGQTPFNSIRYIANVASNVASNDPKAGFVSWNINPADPERYDVLSINNKSFRFSAFTKFVDELLTETDRTLFLDILSDVRLPATDFTVYEPAESFNNRNYHSSAFREPANVFVAHNEDVIKGWLGNSRKRGTMIRNVTDEGINWKRSAVLHWLDKCLLYLELMFVLLQVTWGGPARIAELSVLRITNGQDERRNIYFDGTWLMFLFRYNKTRAILGRDRLIPRYPPPIVVKQLIYYLTLVRPAVSYFMKHFNLPGNDDIDEYLFVDHKVGRWTEQTMYRKFNHITNKHGIGMITASVYRQAAQLIMDNLVKFKWELPDENNVLDESFGHTSRQAITGYAVEIEGGDLLQKNDKAHFKIGGFKWHAIVIPNTSRRGPLPKRGLEDYDNSTPDSSSQQPAHSRPRISTSALTVLPPIQPDVSELVARTQLQSIKPIINPDVEMKPETLVALRVLLNDSNARFKSSFQAKAVQLFLNRLTDLLIILPTGGGKSLTFEIAPLLEPDGCTVLILPFVALMTEMRQRIKKVLPTFKAEQWHGGRRPESALPHILLVSIDEAVSVEFQSFIQIANVNQVVRRWVIDEFHVLITQSDFRVMFPRLVTTIRLIQVPFVGLSATIPESYIDLVRIMMSSVATTVVRSPTDRPNLQYGVFRLQQNNEYELDKELCRLIKNAWDVSTEKEKARYIVFTHTSSAADKFMERVNRQGLGIQAVVYHSKMARDSKEKAYRKWRDGDAKLLVGTGAIGAGMDYPHVRRVWHRGFATSNINFIQEMGRAGRDNKPAVCALIYSSVVEADCKKFISAEYIAEHRKYIDEQGCLRAYITKFIDGAGIDCLSLPDAEMCQPCTTVMSKASLSTGSGRTTMVARQSYQGELNQLAFQDMMLDRTELLEKVRSLMDAVEDVCGVCWFMQQAGKRLANESMSHSLARCRSMFGVCLRCFCRGHNTASCFEFREPVRFRRGCCWRCGFPQYLFGQWVHGDNVSGTCDRVGLQDKLMGIAWMCWRDSLWQGRLNDKFSELLTAGDAEFMKWLGQVGMHGIVNAVWLCLYFYNKSDEELDSLETMHLDSREDSFNIPG